MNCIEFHRVLITDPFTRDEGFVEHQRGCHDCAAAAAKARQFEGVLRRAMEVAPPEGLADRILFRRAITRERRRWPDWRLSLALAASLVLAVGLIPGAVQMRQVGLVQKAAVEYVTASAIVVDRNQRVSAATVNQLLDDFGVVMTGDIGVVNYASRCYLLEKPGVRLVLAGLRGPVTVFVVPGQHTRTRSTFDTGSLAGVVSPCPRGSIVIVANRGERLDVIERSISSGLRWL